MDDNLERSSKYNEAIFQLQRLNESWVNCYKNQRHGSLIAWKFELDNIWLELIADIDKKPVEEAKKVIKKNNELKSNINKAKTRISLYNSIMARHEFLKILQDEAGKGGAYLDGTEDDFE